MPPPLSATDIDDLKKLVGNEQLLAIKDKEADLKKKIDGWKKAREVVSQRKPVWDLVERMEKHAASLPGAGEPLAQIEAIRRERLLLESVDPVTPVRVALAALLRKAAIEAQHAHQTAYDAGMQKLAANATWQQLPEERQKAILAEVGLTPPMKSDVSTDEAMLAALDRWPLGARQAETDAVSGRIDRALELAAKFLEPTVQTVSIERATLRSEADVRQWLIRQETRLVDAVKRGPVLVQ